MKNYSLMIKTVVLVLLLSLGVGISNAQTSTARKVTIVATCEGNSAGNSHLTITWGSPDFNDHQYLNLWNVQHATQDTKSFDLSDKTSEFEIQTQGGQITSYDIQISINGTNAISLKFDKSAGIKENKNLGVVYTQRSSDLNEFGEGNIRINLTKSANPGSIPDKK